MDSKSLCMRTIAGEQVETIPVCLQNYLHAAATAGFSVPEYCLDGEKMAAAHLTAWEVFRHDMIDLENGITAMAQAAGCEVGFPDDGKSAPWVRRPAIEDVSQYAKLKPVDPHRDGLLPEMLKATSIIAHKLGGHACLLCEADQGPFSLAAQLVGAERFLTDLLDPEKRHHVFALLEYASEQVLSYARALSRAGAHLTMIGDSIAGPSVCSPAIYRDFAQPFQRHVIETLRGEGIPMGLHVCGNATVIIEHLVATGAAFLQLDTAIERTVVKRAVSGRTTVIGTVDNTQVLPFGTPEQVAEAALRDIQVFAPQGGFILSSGCTMTYDTPAANVHAMVAAAHG